MGAEAVAADSIDLTAQSLANKGQASSDRMPAPHFHLPKMLKNELSNANYSLPHPVS